MKTVDLVLSGGGVKAFAFIGVLQSFEEHGVTIRNVAGTSAGALMGGLMKAGYSAEELIGMIPEMLQILHQHGQTGKRGLLWWKWFTLYWRKGMHSGAELERWIGDRLATRGIRTFSDLPDQSLRMVTADLAEGKIRVMPDEAEAIGLHNGLTVARAIRMSASLPFYFQPVTIRHKGKEHVMTDGGVVSNFPLWLLQQRDHVPVLGIQLQGQEQQKTERPVKNAVDLLSALLYTMKEAHDARYIEYDKTSELVFLQVPGYGAVSRLSTKEIHALIQTGRVQMDTYFRKRGL